MSNRLTFGTFMERVFKKHGDRFVVFKDNYKGMRSELNLHCRVHKKDLTIERAYQLTQNNPCDDCRQEDRFVLYLEKFHNKLKEYYPQFDCITAPSKFNGTTTLFCHRHGKFDTYGDGVIFARTNCKSCAHELTGQRNKGSSRIPFSEFNLRFADRFGDVLEIQTVESDFVNFSSKVTAQCKVKSHPPVTKTAQNWLKSNGCKFCDESAGERKVRLCLQSLGLEFETEKRFASCRDKKELPFDFWLEEYCLLIEFQGLQHIQSYDRWGGEIALKGVQKRDAIKKKWARDNDIGLLYVETYDSDEIKNTIVNALTKINPESIEDSVERLKHLEIEYISERWSRYLARLNKKHSGNLSFESSYWKPGIKEIEYECLHGHGRKTSNLQGLLKGHGCGECSGNVVTKEDFIKRSVEQFGSKSFDFTDLRFQGMGIRTNIVCSKHGDLDISPENHLRLKTGCKKCGGKSEDYSFDNFLEKARQKFGDESRFDYSRMVYKGTAEKVEVVCRIHGSFWTLPGDHIRVDEKRVDSYRSGCCRGCAKDLRKSPLSKFIVVDGTEFPSISAAARRLNIKPATVRKRLKNGWLIDDAFKTPLKIDK